MAKIEPYISASTILPEFTVRALVLGLVLSVIMCSANIYVGLYAGMTVSAAIPASVISMGVLRGFFKKGTILENNVVHTIAGAGESLSAGIIFTVPAMLLLGLWDKFNYWETTLIAIAGGVLGVVMMIPLRRPMIVEQQELRFPEGVACAEVLKAGDRGGTDMASVFVALGLGAVFKSLVSVVGLFKGTVEGAVRLGKTAWYAGTDISPMLVAVGFIVGWEVSLLLFLGAAISFYVAVPVLVSQMDLGQVSILDAVNGVWDERIRFFGIGAMIVAGVYSIIKIAPSIGSAIRAAVNGVRGKEDMSGRLRTDRDISGKALGFLMVFAFVLGAVIYLRMTGSLVTTAFVSVLMFVLAFFFVAVASYIVGLVGSSNSPVSGMTICTVLVTSGLLLVFGYSGAEGMLATLGVAGVVCCAACTSGDICQDLKIGQIVGATPNRLQAAEVIGAIVPAFIIGPVMQLLHEAYGIGAPAREGVAALKAPQAVMFEKLVAGIFGAGRDIPWNLVGWGAAVGIIAILIDRLFLEPKKTKFRLYAMPLAVGMYLPFTVTAPILIGGLASSWVQTASKRRGDSPAKQQGVIYKGILFSSGIVAGEAIMGILIAFFVLAGLDIPFLKGWAGSGFAADLVSLIALFLIFLLSVRFSLSYQEKA